MVTRGFRRSSALVVAVLLLQGTAAGGVAEQPRWQTCGRFVEVRSIAMPGAYWTRLTDVAHLSTHDAWAVGYQYGREAQGPLAFRWDGRRWTQVKLPSKGPAMAGATLWGVVAMAPGDVWAVGTAGVHPLALHWDGTRWARTPQPDGLHGELESIGPIPGTNGLFAVGRRWVDDVSQPLVERWNGSRWKVVPTPRFLKGGALEDVVSFGAVAYAAGYRAALRPLAMRWDGVRWRVLRVPHGDAYGSLGGVDGTAPGKVWFAGAVETHGVILRWEDGSLRTVKRLDRISGFNDIVVAAPSSIWAVGGVYVGGVDSDPLAFLRSRNGWTQDPRPWVQESSNGLVAIDGTPHDLWALSHDAGEGPASYLLHRC